MKLSALLISACLLAQVSAQTPSPTIAPHKLAFEIASVRENKSGGKATSNILLDRGNVYSPTGGVFTATNQSVITLIIFAYKMQDREALGGFMRSLPSWAKIDNFDINARAASASATKDDMRLMVQSLLEDRFKLKVHRESRAMPAYGLYLSKPGQPGPLLTPHKSSCASPLPTPAADKPFPALVGLWPATCGDDDEVAPAKYRLREGGRDVTMDTIADWLTGVEDSPRPIIDRTKLKETFDYILEFDPDSLDRYGVSASPHDDARPSITEALKEQLGLQLRKEDGIVSIFVVDNIDYPSPN